MRIYDGRPYFYQWDVNVKITADDLKEGDKVSFCNGTTDCVLTVKAYKYDGTIVADVPNIFLTKPFPIKAFKCCEGGECVYTEKKHTFTVKSRPKPSDYIYTETEAVTVKGAVEEALKEAKESGEFDGEQGPKGDPYVLTEKDKTDIINGVLALIPNGDEVSY